MELEYDLGDIKVEVEVTHVEYDPPQNPYTAASDWDCYGHLEVEWEIISVVKLEEDVDVDIDIGYLDQLVREDVMEAINSRDDDY